MYPFSVTSDLPRCISSAVSHSTAPKQIAAIGGFSEQAWNGDVSVTKTTVRPYQLLLNASLAIVVLPTFVFGRKFVVILQSPRKN